MKGLLEFDLPEEEHEHLSAVRATSLVKIIADHDRRLRAWLKRGHRFGTADEALEKAREELWDAIREEDLIGIVER